MYVYCIIYKKTGPEAVLSCVYVGVELRLGEGAAAIIITGGRLTKCVEKNRTSGTFVEWRGRRVTRRGNGGEGDRLVKEREESAISGSFSPSAEGLSVVVHNHPRRLLSPKPSDRDARNSLSGPVDSQPPLSLLNVERFLSNRRDARRPLIENISLSLFLSPLLPLYRVQAYLVE